MGIQNLSKGDDDLESNFQEASEWIKKFLTSKIQIC